MKRRIICIGNRFVTDDSAGPAVYDRLHGMQPLPGGIEVIDGGLRGLNLLPLLEQGGRVVFVDAVRGYGPADRIVVLSRKDILEGEVACRFDHEAGLAYLLSVLPRVCEGEMPEEIALVGIEGDISPRLVVAAAHCSIHLALNGLSASASLLVDQLAGERTMG